MKIDELVVLSSHLWDAPPDPESLDLPILRRLSGSLGAQLSVIVRGAGSRTVTYSFGDGRVTYLPGRWSFLRFLWSGRRAVRAIIRASSSPMVLTSDVLGAALGRLAVRSTPVPMVVQVQGEVIAPGREYGGPFRRLGIRWVTRQALRSAAGIRCLNEHIARKVLELHPTGVIRVIGSRVDLDRFKPAPASLQWGEGRPVILCVGSLTAIKNQRVLIDAFPHVLEQFSNAELWFVGTGGTETMLRRRASEMHIDSAIQFKGRVPHRDMPRLLHEASVFVLPSLSEGQPRAVLEAQAAGVPVVVSDIPGTRDIVEDKVTGRKIPDFDPSTWGTILLELLRDQRQRDTLRANALERVRREHALEPWIDRFNSFLREVAGEA